MDRLQMAYKRASSGKRFSNGFLVFQEYSQASLVDIRTRLIDESWQPEPYRRFIIYEPKMRRIGAPSFADRIVHHSLCSVIEPIMDKTFLPYSFACRFGKGTHAGVKYIQSQLRKNQYTHFLKTDFKSYFPSIDTNILHKEYERKISCKPTLRLLRKIIPIDSVGVPIGALTSQLSANVYGNILDQYLHHHLKVKFARYMDDVIILGNNIRDLKEIKKELEQFAFVNMNLQISRYSVWPVSRGINFLGYRIWPNHKLLRKTSVTRAKRKINNLTKQNDFAGLTRFIGSWMGHARLADSYNLLQYLDNQYQIVMSVKKYTKRPRASRSDLFITLFD